MAFLDDQGVEYLVADIKEKTDATYAKVSHSHTASQLPTASTTASGIVRLDSATTSTSTTYAATASAVNTAWEKAMYGTSLTTASIAAKVVTCPNYSLVTGQLIAVHFSTANTVSGAITLNINSKGAKNVYVNGAATSASNTLLWEANTTILFTYTGSYYYYVTSTGKVDSVHTEGTVTTVIENGAFGFSVASVDSSNNTTGAIGASNYGASATYGDSTGSYSVGADSTGVYGNFYDTNFNATQLFNFTKTAGTIGNGTLPITVTGVVAPTNNTDAANKKYVDDAVAGGGGGGGSQSVTTVTLTVAGWGSNNTQTVNVTGVTATNAVIVTYAPASKSAYTSADIYCSAQGAGTLTFTCTTKPTVAVNVNVMIFVGTVQNATGVSF